MKQQHFYHRKRWAVVALCLALLALVNWLELFLQRKSSSIGAGINRSFFFLLINLHVIVIAVLLYVIIKQSIKLFIERRRKVPGSGFKRNLFFAFAFFTVIPSLFVFFTAGKFITTSIDKWFQVQIGSGLQSGLRLHQALTDRERYLLKEDPHQLNNVVQYEWSVHGDEACHAMLSQETLLWRTHRSVNDRSMKTLRKEFFAKLALIARGDDQTFDFYGALYRVLRSENRFRLWRYQYPDAVRIPLMQLQNGYDDFLHLKSMQQSIYSTYTWTFVLIVLLILLLSIWCAFYLSKGISMPIQALLRATERIRKGHWDTTVTVQDQHDLQPLATGFNAMTSEVKHAHEALEKKNKQMFTILESINDSVFYIDHAGKIIMLNQAAKKLVSPFTPVAQLKRRRVSFLPATIRKAFMTLVRDFSMSGKKQLSREVSVMVGHTKKILVAHVSYMEMMKEEGGVLFVVQDVTDIVKLSTTKAWQEAAKQVAHEIKNPLTPIQLATQRLQKKYQALFAHDPAFTDCTETILDHVTIIKDLASHFSQFASMPAPQIEQVDICQLVQESLHLYRLSYPDISFVYETSHDEMLINSDNEKLKQVMLNLLDNSIRAFSEDRCATIHKEIRISLCMYPDQKVLDITVQDNGPGIHHKVKETLFMPHISTHKKNMGLGLAIVHDIIKQLGGSVALLPTEQGATFKISLVY